MIDTRVVDHIPVALVRVRYTAPQEAVAMHADAHRAYLNALAETGTVLLAGPLDPHTGGVVLVALPDDARAAAERVEVLRRGDPYVRAGVAVYEVARWHVRIGWQRLSAPTDGGP